MPDFAERQVFPEEVYYVRYVWPVLSSDSLEVLELLHGLDTFDPAVLEPELAHREEIWWREQDRTHTTEISGDMIKAGSIRAGSITASEIAVGSITADTIVAGSVKDLVMKSIEKTLDEACDLMKTYEYDREVRDLAHERMGERGVIRMPGRTERRKVFPAL